MSGEIIDGAVLRVGGFRGMEIHPLSEYYGAEPAMKAARHYEADIDTLMLPVVAGRCGGNPFYITVMVQQRAEMEKPG